MNQKYEQQTNKDKMPKGQKFYPDGSTSGTKLDCGRIIQSPTVKRTLLLKRLHMKKCPICSQSPPNPNGEVIKWVPFTSKKALYNDILDIFAKRE